MPILSPAIPYAFENVLETKRFGNSRQPRAIVSPQNSKYASSMSTAASGAARAISFKSVIGTNVPVGLLGFATEINRVRSLIAARTDEVGNVNSCTAGMAITRAPVAVA